MAEPPPFNIPEFLTLAEKLGTRSTFGIQFKGARGKVLDRRIGERAPRDPKIITRVVINECNKIWKAASRAALAAMVFTTPVDTGMARGSFIPVGKALGAATAVKEVIQPKRRRKGYTTIFGNWRPNVPKDVALGRRLGNQAFKVKFGKVSRPTFEFSYNLRTFQQLFHNFGISVHSGDWRTLNAGGLAFQQAAKLGAQFLQKSLPQLVIEGIIRPISLGKPGRGLGSNAEGTQFRTTLADMRKFMALDTKFIPANQINLED